jgi:hypothetical protein
MRRLFAATLCFALVACGPTSGEEDVDGGGPGGEDAGNQQDVYYEPPNAHVTGIVYAPNGRTFTPPLTVSGALVYLTESAPPAIPLQVYCERCTEVPSGAHFVKTDASGAFDLNVWSGPYIMVIQKGQFRLVRSINVGAGQTFEVPPEDTTLPSSNSTDGNDTIPRMALLSGNYDQLEDLLAKVGFAGLDTSTNEVDWNAPIHMDVYDNQGNLPPTGSQAYNAYKGTALSLLTNYELLKSYHIIFVPCAYTNDEVVTNATAQANLKQYVKEGGKLYVADYSYDYMRQVWDMVHFRNEDGNPPTPGTGNSGPMYNSQGHAVDTDLYAWLEAQQPGWGGDSLVLKEDWDLVTDLTSGYIGDDPENGAQYAKPDVIVEGPHDSTSKWSTPGVTNYPLTVGFPYGCGRVLYTTYHTVGEMSGPHAGIEVQERILIYLIMEIGVCQTGPILE